MFPGWAKPRQWIRVRGLQGTEGSRRSLEEKERGLPVGRGRIGLGSPVGVGGRETGRESEAARRFAAGRCMVVVLAGRSALRKELFSFLFFFFFFLSINWCR